MEKLEVLPSSDSTGKKLVDCKEPSLDWTFTNDGDILSEDDFPQFCLSDVNASVDSPMISSVGNAGLEELLQTGPELQSKDSMHTLAELLTSESPISVPLGVINQSSRMPVIPDSVMIEGEPFNNGRVLPSGGQTVSEHTLSTAGTLVQILQNGTSAVACRSMASEHHSTHDEVVRDEPITTGAATSRSDVPDAMAVALAEDNGLFVNLETDTLPLLNGDDSSISLDNGIEATDMCSLLEQFEAVENFTSLADDLMLPTSTDSSGIIKLNEDVELLGQDQLRLFSPSHCQIIQDDTSSADTRNGQPASGQGQARSSDSEVMKLLKTSHITVPRMARARAADQAIPRTSTTPSAHTTQKNKVQAKSNSILLASSETSTVASRSSLTRSNLDKSSTIRKLLKGSVNTKLNSPRASPSRMVVKEVKRLNLSQYRQRAKQYKVSSSDDSNDSCSSSAVEDNRHGCKVGSDYLDAIADHDYCQNTSSCLGMADDPNCMLKSLLLNKNLSEELKEQAIKDRAVTRRNMRTAGITHPCGELAPLVEPSLASSTMPQSEQSESCKQAPEGKSDIEPMVTNTSELGNGSQDKENLRQISPDRDQCRQVLPDRHSSGQNSPDGHISRQFSSGKQSSLRRTADGRQSDKLEKHDKTEVIIDKLPSYCTALAVEPIPGMKVKKSVSVTDLLDTRIPCCDRDPSPERLGPVFDKVPAYFSCFTNSTKYDTSDPVQMDIRRESYPWDRIRSNHSSTVISRRQSPTLSRSSSPSSCRSRSSSRSSSSPRSRSPSVGRSWHHSIERGSSSSPSISRSSCESFSSSSSKSRATSHSRRCHERSRPRRRSSRSRSHHRSPSCRSRSPSYSRSRSRHHSRKSSEYSSRSRYRSHSRGRSRTRSRSRSRDRYWRKYREEMRLKREREKQQRIEQRRIVYIGRIPNDMTKQLLRRRFEQFGEIEEVSVHFREHGDNYGFVTYRYTCDAYDAIERGNSLHGCENFDLCFGGRREFCKTSYADLDGDKEDEEEMGSVLRSSYDDLDFDTLLKQATKKIKKY